MESSMGSTSFAAMSTPSGTRGRLGEGGEADISCEVEEASTIERLETASQVDRALQMEANRAASPIQAPRVQFNDTLASERSSRMSRSDHGWSLARAYKPTAQERMQHILEGPMGLYLELVNLIFSLLTFALHIAELYDREIGESILQRTIELTVTAYFIFDLCLHMFVAPHPLTYLFSVYGVIDMLTIIPSFLVYAFAEKRSQTFFILRVLRIFRALRVLRLKQFIKHKSHGFNYELSVFLVSSIAVILCAAGMYHAIEEESYLDNGESFYFHEALYFILVTISTVGFGDISPQTSLGQVFVMVVIVAVFTIVPQKAAKLNALAKQNHQYDKDYRRRSNRSGHVIVSGYDLSTDCVLDFLDEFYHSSRGNILLDVVFICEARPSREVLHLLATDRYVHRTRYLRGSLSNGEDQQRVRLGDATAVFFLANKLFRRESAQQDTTTVLHTLAVRNFADSWDIHLDIYLQLRSQQELEVTSQLLGGNTTNTSGLRTIILSRAAICPGASTLFLNLLHSVDPREYACGMKDSKMWLDEYVDGMSNQIFPVIFNKRFQYHKYNDVVRNIYSQYGAMLIMIRPRRTRCPVGGDWLDDQDLRIAPFDTFIKEGDTGIVIAKSASTVLHIVNTYGYCNEYRASPSGLALPVRVSSDNLIKRPSPRPRMPHDVSPSAASFEDHDDTSFAAVRPLDELNSTTSIKSTPSSPQFGLGYEDTVCRSPAAGSSTIMPIVSAIRAKRMAKIQSHLERDHFVLNVKQLEGHFVIGAGRLRDALSLVAHIRRFCATEKRFRPALKSHDRIGMIPRFSAHPVCVLLVEELPTPQDMVHVFRRKEENGEDTGTLLQSVLFVAGSATKMIDLGKVAIARARRVLLFPPQVASFKFRQSGPLADTSAESRSLRQESLADFGVINALLVAEAVREEMTQQPGGGFSSRGWQSSRGDNVRSASSFYNRQRDQGLPLESIKLRVLERYPDLESSMFDEGNAMLKENLQQYDQEHDMVETECGVIDSARGGDIPEALDGLNTLGMLHHASNAKFTRPRDPAVNHDEFPCLAPSYASGNVFLSSVLDRIICQAFYNPYITDIVYALAVGEGMSTTTSSSPREVDGRSGTPGSQAPRRLFQVTVHESYVGVGFVHVFNDFLALNLLVIGILRYPNLLLENLRPFVYTCPRPETTMHANDRLFVLG